MNDLCERVGFSGRLLMYGSAKDIRFLGQLPRISLYRFCRKSKGKIVFDFNETQWPKLVEAKCES